ALYRVDLRCAETHSPGVEGGTSSDAESDCRVQKEERQSGRAQNQRSAAMQSAAGMLHGAESDSRPAADAALPQPGGAPGAAHEETYRGCGDGNRYTLQQGTAAR